MSVGDGSELDVRSHVRHLTRARAVRDRGAANRVETYVLLEAVRAPGACSTSPASRAPEEARFTAAKRLEIDGLFTLLGPFTYQVTRKGRDPRLLADVALEWIRRKA